MALKIIILAGGKGTRIKKVLKNTPKIMAPINGKPFLDWLILWIYSWKINEKIDINISTCVGHEIIKGYCESKHISVKCIAEKKTLGTFGALANVASNSFSENYLVLNGDTLFEANIKKIYENYKNKINKKPLIILKKNNKNTRYGGYKKDNNGWIFSSEKSNFISLGAFFISHKELIKRWGNCTSIPFVNSQINNLNSELMIDKDCFQKDPIRAEILDLSTPFIDIGIPSSLEEAKKFIPKIFGL